MASIPSSIPQQLPLFALDKACSRCKKTKPREALSNDAKRKDGLRVWCRECSYEYNKMWDADHREQRLASRHKSYIRHRPQYDAYMKQWRERNIDHYRATQRAYTASYRARMAGVEGTFTHEDVWAMYEKQAGKCAYCGKDMGEKYNVDHMLPPVRGGTNWPDNLTLACPRCNKRKGIMTADEFRESLAKGRRSTSVRAETY